MMQQQRVDPGPGPAASVVIPFLRTQPRAVVEHEAVRNSPDQKRPDRIVDVETRDLFSRRDRVYVSERSKPNYGALRGIFDRLRPRPIALVLPDSDFAPTGEELRRLTQDLRVDFLGTATQFMDRRINSDIIARSLDQRPDLLEAMKGYVPQHVRDENGQQMRQESLSLIEQWEKDQDSRLLVLLADAGHGKTMLTRTLAHRLAGRYQTESSRKAPSPVPLLIAFGPELAGRFTTFEGLVTKYFNGMVLQPLPLKMLQFLINRRRIIFILDGLDELFESDFAKAQDNLREFISMAGPDAKVILTSRKAFFRTSEAVERGLMQPLGVQEVKLYELQPFDDAQVDAFVAKVHPSKRAGLSRVLAHPETRELARTPHVLASLAQVAPYVEVDRPGTSTFELLFPAIARREQQNQQHDVPAEVQKAFLVRLAREMLVSGETEFPGGTVAVIAAEAVDLLPEWAGSIPIQQLELLENHYCLSGTKDGVLVFQAQYWREYFLALALAELAVQPGPQFDLVMHQAALPEGVLRNVVSHWSDSLRERVLGLLGAGSANRNAVPLIGHASAAGHVPRRIVADRAAPGSLNGATFNGAIIEALDLRGMELKGCDLSGATFVGCSLMGVDFAGSRLDNTSFVDCRLTGANFSTSELASLSVDEQEAAGRVELQAVLAAAGAHSPWQEGEVVAVGAADTRESDALAYGTEVLHSALEQYWDRRSKVFIKQRVLVPYFAKGFDPVDAEYLLRRLYPALRRAGYLAEHSFGGHEPVIALLADRRDELARFMRERSMSDDLRRAVLDSLRLGDTGA